MERMDRHWMGCELLLEDDSERARERARLQITPRFDYHIDIVSLLVEATENSIENREAGLPASGPFESVVKTMGEDGRRVEEERDRLKDKLVDYEGRINDVCQLLSTALDDSSCIMSDIRRLNPFDCLQRLEETAGTLVHQKTARMYRSGVSVASTSRAVQVVADRVMSEEERLEWIDNFYLTKRENYEKKTGDVFREFVEQPSDHLSYLRTMSEQLNDRWPNDRWDRSCAFLPYHTAILFLASRANIILNENETLRQELYELQSSLEGTSCMYSIASDQWHTVPPPSPLSTLTKTLLFPVRRMWTASKRFVRRHSRYRN